MEVINSSQDKQLIVSWLFFIYLFIYFFYIYLEAMNQYNAVTVT